MGGRRPELGERKGLRPASTPPGFLIPDVQTRTFIDRVCFSSESNFDFCRKDYVERFLMPAGHKRLRFVLEHDVLYTWARPSRVLDSAPTILTWMEQGGEILWLVDVVMMPYIKPRRAIRAIIEDMKDQRIAKEGEKIVFYRSGPQRYGHVRA